MKLLNMYFDILYPIISVNNKVILPEKYKKGSKNHE